MKIVSLVFALSSQFRELNQQGHLCYERDEKCIDGGVNLIISLFFYMKKEYQDRSRVLLLYSHF